MKWQSTVWRRLPLMAACGLLGCAGMVPSGTGSSLAALHTNLNGAAALPAAAANVPTQANGADEAADPPVLASQLRAKGIERTTSVAIPAPAASTPPDLTETLDTIEVEEDPVATAGARTQPSPATETDVARTPPFEPEEAAPSLVTESGGRGRAPRVAAAPSATDAGTQAGLVIPPPPPALAASLHDKKVDANAQTVSPTEFERQLSGESGDDTVELVEDERTGDSDNGEPVEFVDDEGNRCEPQPLVTVEPPTDVVACKTPAEETGSGEVPVSDPVVPTGVAVALDDPWNGTTLAGEDRLDIRTLELCRQVSGFGRIEAANDASLGPGRAVLAYAEVDNFPIVQEGDEYVTRLAARIVLESSGGTVVEQWDFGDIVDHCRARRKDFYCHFTFTLPERLKAGTYVLRLKLRDPRGGALAERTRELSISTPPLAKGR